MVNAFELKNGLMLFKDIANANGTTILSLAWRFSDIKDGWSKRIDGFKEQNSKSIMAACEVMPFALSKISWNGNSIAVITAISSSEEAINPKSGLYQLGSSIANRLGWAWKPYAIKKHVHKSLHTIATGNDRDNEIYKKISGRF
ncbi:hypothetical protein [Desulforegula conservatrix]|uniref:hypothetical protein n=1 Tax=Desulforegula conservatrix TaxID=153026 RepID=UPI0004803C91|nr:hypothetical protein [Desulforegula conservatrix]